VESVNIDFIKVHDLQRKKKRFTTKIREFGEEDNFLGPFSFLECKKLGV
jgi:hypothetical protein